MNKVDKLKQEITTIELELEEAQARLKDMNLHHYQLIQKWKKLSDMIILEYRSQYEKDLMK